MSINLENIIKKKSLLLAFKAFFQKVEIDTYFILEKFTEHVEIRSLVKNDANMNVHSLRLLCFFLLILTHSASFKKILLFRNQRLRNVSERFFRVHWTSSGRSSTTLKTFLEKSKYWITVTFIYNRNALFSLFIWQG